MFDSLEQHLYVPSPLYMQGASVRGSAGGVLRGGGEVMRPRQGLLRGTRRRLSPQRRWASPSGSSLLGELPHYSPAREGYTDVGDSTVSASGGRVEGRGASDFIFDLGERHTCGDSRSGNDDKGPEEHWRLYGGKTRGHVLPGHNPWW